MINLALLSPRTCCFVLYYCVTADVMRLVEIPLPMKLYFDIKWIVFSDAVQIRNILEAESMNIAEDNKELGHRNVNRRGFCLIYRLHILSNSFRFFCSVPQNFFLWYEKLQWPETPVFTRLFISVYRTLYFCTHRKHKCK